MQKKLLVCLHDTHNQLTSSDEYLVDLVLGSDQNQFKD